MVVDLTDPNRPRFTLQELRDVLQERNKLKSQLLVVQEELQCYKRWVLLWGWGVPRRGWGARTPQPDPACISLTRYTLVLMFI